MPKVRIKKLPSKYSRVPQNDVLGEEIRKKGGKVHDQNMIGNITNPDYMDMGGIFTRMNTPVMDTNMYDQGGMADFARFYQEEFKKGGWLKGAVNPKHKGFCTPMSKSTCTGHRRAFAETMKKHHGFHGLGGNIPEFKEGGKTMGKGAVPDLTPTGNHGVPDYNPYVYFKDKNWYISSNPEDDTITGSMKPIDRESANIEAEKGEYMTKPGLTGLYKITGKTHAEGGTPLYAEGGSFIFSNDPKLAINKQERDNFGFKTPVSTAKSKNTPAQIVGREVNPKEYNGFIATLENPDTDKIAKTTAGLMLEKMQQKLGQIAYLQENKKNQKPPDFSQGTAPMNNPKFEDINERMNEYAYGGMYPTGGEIDPNTGLPITLGDQYPGGRTTLGKITPKGLSNTFNYPGGVPNLIKDWQGVGVDLSNMNSKDAQSAMYGWAQKNNPQLLRNLWSTYGNTAQGKQQGLNYDYDNLNDQQLGNAKGAYTDGMLGARTFSPSIPHQPMNYTPPLQPLGTPPNVQIPPPGQPAQPINPQPNIPTLPYNIKGKLNDSQIAHLGYLGLQSLNINRYYPKREQVSLPDVRLDRVNDQPYINNINNQSYAANQLASIQPRTSALLSSNIRGTAIDQANQAIGNVANQNVQIGNQQNLTNLQQRSQQVMANSQFDNNYYNQVQGTNQNFDNERRFANNQFFSNLNNYQSQADQLAWGLAAVNKYGVRKVTDPKTGQVYNLPTPLYEATGRGINFNADVANLNMASGANRINTPGEISDIYRQFKQIGMPDVEAQRIISTIIRSRGTNSIGQGPVYMQNPYSAFGQ